MTDKEHITEISSGIYDYTPPEPPFKFRSPCGCIVTELGVEEMAVRHSTILVDTSPGYKGEAWREKGEVVGLGKYRVVCYSCYKDLFLDEDAATRHIAAEEWVSNHIMGE